ncbi:hypothetical protein CWB66_21600 [Pseudoalteromonas sp. S558]|nr:hypothetical protein CWB66_21600 [Pseudoalteromonas sp. S558]
MKNYQLEHTCWFCSEKDGLLVFDGEFDTYVHLKCIREALQNEPDHLEARLMKYLIEDESATSIGTSHKPRHDLLPF